MAKWTVPGFLRDQWRKIPSVDTFKADLSGRTIIVTGANTGLGFEAARHLARMNPGRLILACRDMKKGQAAIDAIVKDTGCRALECWTLDLADFNSVKAFADRFEVEGGGSLDLLIENAGIFPKDLKKTKDGWEACLQVNHIATMQLGLRLLPYLLKATANPPTPRLVVVSSELHYLTAGLDKADQPNLLGRLNDLQRSGKLEAAGNRYLLSKLLNVLFVRELASRLRASTALTINAVNPGFCESGLARENRNPPFAVLEKIVGRTTEVGSRMLVHASVAASLQGVTGAYLTACTTRDPSDWTLSAQGHAVQKRLWDETMDVLIKVDPKVLPIVQQYLK